MFIVLRTFGRLLGILALGPALVFFFLDFADHRMPIWSLAALCTALSLIWMGRSSKTIPKNVREAHLRIRDYLDVTPDAKRLSRWANWLRFLVLPLIAGWIWITAIEFPQLGAWSVVIAFVFILPSVVLNSMALRGYPDWRRARASLQSVQDE